MKRAIGMLMTARWAGTNPNGYYRTLTLDQPSSDLTDFPVLFSGTFTYLKTAANGGKVQNASGFDIVFYSDVTLTTKLKFERVYWSATTGDVEFWVKIPTLTSASATIIYLAYGNTTISTDQQDIVNTWNSAFIGVWHFPDGTSLSVLDSTSNNNDGTNTGPPTASAGKIDGAMTVTPIQYTDVGNLGVAGLPFSYSIWIRPSGTAGSRAFWGTGTAGGLEIRVNNSTNTIFVIQENTAAILSTVGTAPSGQWTHIFVTIDSGANNVKVYINNAAAETATLGITFASANTWIGSSQNLEAFAGDIDEAKVSNVVRNADWVATEYSNQNDPANFYVIGTETTA